MKIPHRIFGNTDATPCTRADSAFFVDEKDQKQKKRKVLISLVIDFSSKHITYRTRRNTACEYYYNCMNGF